MPLFGPIIKKLKITYQIARLRSPDAHIRTDAAWALGQIGDPRAVEPLVNALDYGNDFVLQAAAQALGKLGHPRAVELHVGVLKDDSDGGLVREAPASELLQIGDARAVEPPHPSWPRSETQSSSSARRPPGL